MTSTTTAWEKLYTRTPLCDIPFHYHNINNSPYLLRYLHQVLTFAPQKSRTLETGIGSGLGAIWLARRGVNAVGMDNSRVLVERAIHANNMLGASANFFLGDLFTHYKNHTATNASRWQVIHHQGVLEHFNKAQIRAIIAQQVVTARWVVFSVPSAFYGEEPEFGDEHLLTTEIWRHILAPFETSDVRYYGDDKNAAKDHILVTLKGQDLSEELLHLMEPAEHKYPAGISGIVHTRNEERHITACLNTLQGWTDEIIVCDMESTDGTVNLAQQVTPRIVTHPLIQNFDRARNASAMLAKYRWIFYLDADERVPQEFGIGLRRLAMENGDSFEALHPPFRHYFAGHWMKSLYPGYTAPRLFKNGYFTFNSRLHSGAIVNGATIRWPADNPDLSLEHYSYDSLHHYLEKLNRYTDGEAANLFNDGYPFQWQNALRHFVSDFTGYYDRGDARKDGVHGFLWSFLSAFYRFEQHAKLYERRFHAGLLQPHEGIVPNSVREALQFMLDSIDAPPVRRAVQSIIVTSAPAEESTTPRVLWSGPLLDPSGYGEESRHLMFALAQTGHDLACQIRPWNHDADMTAAEQEIITKAAQREVAPGFTYIQHDFPLSFQKHDAAGLHIGRTVFETDRLPPGWAEALNRMDRVWVASEFNRTTFTDAGVHPAKIVVIPECFDPAPYQVECDSLPLLEEFREGRTKLFLSVFDWTSHKGWDVLLRGFIRAFQGRSDVGLVLKVWSTLGYTPTVIQEMAAELTMREMNHDILADTRIRWIFDRLSRNEMIALYRGVDAFVLPSRGEGWGRPYMEAMAAGTPVVGTNWGGNTAFLNQHNSLLLGYKLLPVPSAALRELPTFAGHRWAEPDEEQLVAMLQELDSNITVARDRANAAQMEICATYNYETVGRLMALEIGTCLTRLDIAASAEERKPTATEITPAARPICGTAADSATAAPTRARRRTKPVPSSAILPATIRWEGDFFQWHSLALVNREFCSQLLSHGIELSVVAAGHTQYDPAIDPISAMLEPHVFAPLSHPADVHVRHHFPPRFNHPNEGKFVLIQPWEYGYLPEAWVKPITQEVDEVWCYSNYVRDVYNNSGVPMSRLHVVPLGVNTSRFSPNAPPYIFTSEHGYDLCDKSPTAKPFVFLFVGGAMHRKGIDILLDAYLNGFSAYDDVLLVIKDTGVDTVYKGQTEREKIIGISQDKSRPRIVYIDRELSQAQLAGLYAMADCLVQPYRGEGFCLPVLESMSCGTAVIVPAGGPTDDFVSEESGWRVPAEKLPMTDCRVGPWVCAGPIWQFEISPRALAQVMHVAVSNRDAVNSKGAAARTAAEQSWSWRHSGVAAMARIGELRGMPSAPSKSDPAPAATTRPTASLHHTFTPHTTATYEVRQRPTISLCIIAKDEQRVLADCLSSAQPWVDEIILVDTGSTDDTVKIATSYGAKIFHYPWNDDFSSARNESIKHANGGWIFWMDADDTLPEQCGAKLKDLVFSAEDSVAGFIMQVHIPAKQGESGYTVVDHVKLFRNNPAIRFEGRIHEQILEPLHRTGGKIERTQLHVVHSGYDYSDEGQRRKRERDLRILAQDLAERPNHPFVLFNCGMTHFYMGNHDEAIPHLENALLNSQSTESISRKIYALLAACYLAKDDLELAKQHLEDGLRLFPLDPELNFRAGLIYTRLNNYSAAEMCYLNVINRPETGHIDSLDVSIISYKAPHNLAMLYADQGRLQEAEYQWLSALKSEPNFKPSIEGLILLYARQGRLAEAETMRSRLNEHAN